ncbi:PIG-L deacetylase family protein [Candidatus Latescibacterota bacterium]
MEKNTVLGINDLGSAVLGNITGIITPEDARSESKDKSELIIEKDMPKNTHKGKVFAAFCAHAREIPYYSGGTCAKLISEGYTGYLVRTSNDDKSGEGTLFQNILSNETETLNMSKVLGFSDVVNLWYPEHHMHSYSSSTILSRLIYILRWLKVDTAISFLPFAFGERNSDHLVTGRTVEQACYMSGMEYEYPEHLDYVQAHTVKEHYYPVVKSGQPFNRVVDIGSSIDKKISAIVECRSQGGNSGSQLRKKLAGEGKRLPILGKDDHTADREYVRNFIITPYKHLGVQYGMEFAEQFYYIDNRPKGKSEIEEYIEKNAVKL